MCGLCIQNGRIVKSSLNLGCKNSRLPQITGYNMYELPTHCQAQAAGDTRGLLPHVKTRSHRIVMSI